MASRPELRRYRAWYARLLRLYPRRHRERFGEGMAQTFNDLLVERVDAGEGCFKASIALFIETAGSIMKSNWHHALQSRHLVRPALGTGLVLCVPLLMSVLDRDKAAGDGWHWGPGDFIVMGALLFGAGLLYEFLTRKSTRSSQRAVAGAAIGLAVLLVWAELAVDGVSQLATLLLG